MLLFSVLDWLSSDFLKCLAICLCRISNFICHWSLWRCGTKKSTYNNGICSERVVHLNGLYLECHGILFWNATFLRSDTGVYTSNMGSAVSSYHFEQLGYLTGSPQDKLFRYHHIFLPTVPPDRREWHRFQWRFSNWRLHWAILQPGWDLIGMAFHRYRSGIMGLLYCHL